MIGKNSLWVAKQHSHSAQTMLETDTAWLEGTTAADVEAIKAAIQAPSRPAQVVQRIRPSQRVRVPIVRLGSLQPQALSLEPGWKSRVPENYWKILAEREGFEPSKGLLPYTLSRGAPSTTRPSLRVPHEAGGRDHTGEWEAGSKPMPPALLPARNRAKCAAARGRTSPSPRGRPLPRPHRSGHPRPTPPA